MNSTLMFLRLITRNAVFTAFVYVLGLVPLFTIPGIPVPIVLQNMGVFLAGSILGPSGALSLLFLLLLALMGLPVLAGGRGSVAVFVSPSVGFLISYVVVAFLVGLLAKRYWRSINFSKFFLINLLGLVVMYAIGVPVMAFIADLSITVAFFAVLWYIPLDIVKIIIVCAVAKLFKQFYPMVSYRNLSYGIGVSDTTGRQTKENITVDVEK